MAVFLFGLDCPRDPGPYSESRDEQVCIEEVVHSGCGLKAKITCWDETH